MAKENSFDIVSAVDLMEMENAVNQTAKELAQRFDLKDSGAAIAFDKKETVTITAPSDFVVKQVRDVLAARMTKRGVDATAVAWADLEKSGMEVRQSGKLVMGIEQDLAKKITKELKAQKFKATFAIAGDKLKATSPSRDELQNVIAWLKKQDFGIPLQFENYR